MESLRDTVTRTVDETINPLLAVDRGSMEVVDVDERTGVVRVCYRGRCAGCPALAITHRKVVSAALIAADRAVTRVEYTLLEKEDTGQ